MSPLQDWAAAWGIPTVAMDDLRVRLTGLDVVPTTDMAAVPKSEAAVQAEVRLEASAAGCRLWRNNVGAGFSEEGNFMRWGLANDSKQVNRVLKSSDLIGIRPWIIQPQDVGRLVGQFLCREVKEGNWKFRGTEREVAQMNWINLINSLGGDAAFASRKGTI